MTRNTLQRLMRRHKLTQQKAADLMEVSQPTLHDILHGRHNLTEKNADAFQRNLATVQAMEDDGDKVRAACAGNPNRLFHKRQFIEHLPTCAECLNRAYEGGASYADLAQNELDARAAAG